MRFLYNLIIFVGKFVPLPEDFPIDALYSAAAIVVFIILLVFGYIKILIKTKKMFGMPGKEKKRVKEKESKEENKGKENKENE